MTDSGETIKQMIKLIEQEAREKAQAIEEDGKHRMHIEKNKKIKEEREKVLKEFKKMEESEIVRAKTQKSRIINRNRLEVQTNRNELVKKLKLEIEESLKNKFKDKAVYKELLKG